MHTILDQLFVRWIPFQGVEQHIHRVYIELETGIGSSGIFDWRRIFRWSLENIVEAIEQHILEGSIFENCRRQYVDIDQRLAGRLIYWMGGGGGGGERLCGCTAAAVGIVDGIEG